jgi:hypothetical protein
VFNPTLLKSTRAKNAPITAQTKIGHKVFRRCSVMASLIARDFLGLATPTKMPEEQRYRY